MNILGYQFGTHKSGKKTWLTVHKDFKDGIKKLNFMNKCCLYLMQNHRKITSTSCSVFTESKRKRIKSFKIGGFIPFFQIGNMNQNHDLIMVATISTFQLCHCHLKKISKNHLQVEVLSFKQSKPKLS